MRGRSSYPCIIVADPEQYQIPYSIPLGQNVRLSPARRTLERTRSNEAN